MKKGEKIFQPRKQLSFSFEQEIRTVFVCEKKSFAYWKGLKNRILFFFPMLRILKQFFSFFLRDARPFFLKLRGSSSQILSLPVSQAVSIKKSRMTVEAYVRKGGGNFFSIHPPERVPVSLPCVFPVEAKNFFLKSHPNPQGYEFPALSVAQFSGATVKGGSDFITTSDAVLHLDLYDPERDLTLEEFHLRGCLIQEPPFKMATISVVLPAAACFLHGCAHNYAHWLTEVLPRIALFCSQTQFDQVPLLIDADLGPSFMDSLFSVVEPHRKIYTLAKGVTLSVKELYVTSACGYVPFRFLANQDVSLQTYQGSFSPYALNLLRKKVFETLCAKNVSLPIVEQLYCQRTSSLRTATNLKAIEHRLKEAEYTLIRPEQYRFLEQVHFFSQARHIVSLAGAAMANLIFAHPKAKVVLMMAHSDEIVPWYWTHLFAAAGGQVTYLMGTPQKKRGDLLHHPSFHISEDLLDEILSKNS